MVSASQPRTVRWTAARATVMILVIAWLIAAGSGEEGVAAAQDVRPPVRIQIAGRPFIFDPSVAAESPSGRVWMAYSEASGWPHDPTTIVLSTRMAHSDDGGFTWGDDGAINLGADLPDSGSRPPGVWVHETPRLLYDPWGTPEERWLLFWHRYVKLARGVQDFRRSWIGLRTAPHPLSLSYSSPERKLLAGRAYDRGDDGVIGPPEVRLPDLHPDLAHCDVPSEMGALATPDAIYLSVNCATRPAVLVRQVLLRRPRATGRWEYVGTLSDAGDARAMGYAGFSATELVQQDGRSYLFVTPENPSNFYRGCLVFEIESLDGARLVRRDSLPVVLARIELPPSAFGGVCTYDPALAGGIIYGEAFFGDPDPVRLYMSFVRLP
jgi:hypothetical protein